MMPFKDPLKKADYAKQYIKKYLANPENRRHVNSVANIRATKIRRWLDEYKMKAGCVDCNYSKHHSALHFDHVQGEKHINVANSKSLKQAREEIKKCVVRCANCHAVKTFKFYPCKPDIFEATYEAVE